MRACPCGPCTMPRSPIAAKTPTSGCSPSSRSTGKRWSASGGCRSSTPRTPTRHSSPSPFPLRTVAPASDRPSMPTSPRWPPPRGGRRSSSRPTSRPTGGRIIRTGRLPRAAGTCSRTSRRAAVSPFRCPRSRLTGGRPRLLRITATTRSTRSSTTSPTSFSRRTACWTASSPSTPQRATWTSNPRSSHRRRSGRVLSVRANAASRRTTHWRRARLVRSSPSRTWVSCVAKTGTSTSGEPWSIVITADTGWGWRSRWPTSVPCSAPTRIERGSSRRTGRPTTPCWPSTS